MHCADTSQIRALLAEMFLDVKERQRIMLLVKDELICDDTPLLAGTPLRYPASIKSLAKKAISRRSGVVLPNLWVRSVDGESLSSHPGRALRGGRHSSLQERSSEGLQ